MLAQLDNENKSEPYNWPNKYVEIAKIKIKNPTFQLNKKENKTITYNQLIKEITNLTDLEKDKIEKSIENIIKMKGDLYSFFLSIARQINNK